ncbi:formylglycine-generating enzyme family protein [Pseudomonas fluorescens]|uniref:formylglycine-generating enzyme family protein n=1 Tax=Pseudomonas fluorescens TaxID=294 RepID=UPI00177BA6ED|nr:SUMF1/EgtB/PvdO family nonheme iron enzyme [Pseudomonas fluorescens]
MKLRSLSLALFVLVFVSGCEQAANQDNHAPSEVSADELLGFINQVKGNLVFVEGGDFLMGDYGVQYGAERLPYDSDKDSKPLHEVKLSGYSIGKFKVTNKEYQFYLQDNGMQQREMDPGNQQDWKEINSAPNTPAHMDWYEAEKYCSWLARISDLPFAMPTEAQWEYAARSRGQFLMVATDDGTYKVTPSPVTEDDGPRGINISTTWDRKAFARKNGWQTGIITPLPVDMFAPNPLGLYSMSDNGEEWVKDWYDPEYYRHSPILDPQGPDEPTFKDSFGHYTKVARGVGIASPLWGGGVNVHRTAVEPHGDAFGDGNSYLTSTTARCVINSSTPIK